MSIDVWEKEIEEIRAITKLITSQAAKYALSDVIRKLDKKIDDEENRINNKLKTVIIDGKSYKLPNAFNFYNFEEFTLSLDGDILYAIDKRGRLDNDGSYHSWHYAWIPNGNKFTKLLVRTLGKDSYGDRYFAETDHYKHPADQNVAIISVNFV